MLLFAGIRVNFCLILFICIFSSCEIINPDEQIPAYIRVDNFNLKIKAGEGTTSHKITDVWINIDGNLIGVFELPATIPLLAQGKHQMILRAGIKKNGISASRAFYPFYTMYQLDTLFSSGQIMVFHPEIQYREGISFYWMEDFESQGFTLKRGNKSDTTLMPEKNEVFEGTQSAAIFLDDVRLRFDYLTVDSLYFPKNGTPIYLELNYKNNYEFLIGLYINKKNQTIQSPVIYLNPSDDWNKIYINLTDMILSHSDALHFNIFIGAFNKDFKKDIKIYLDNIKLIKVNE